MFIKTEETEFLMKILRLQMIPKYIKRKINFSYFNFFCEEQDGKFGIDIRMLFYHKIWEFNENKEIIDIFFKRKGKYLCENYSEMP